MRSLFTSLILHSVGQGSPENISKPMEAFRGIYNFNVICVFNKQSKVMPQFAMNEKASLKSGVSQDIEMKYKVFRKESDNEKKISKEGEIR